MANNVNTPNDSTIQGTPPVDYNSMANSLSYISANFPAASPLVNLLTQQIQQYSNNWKYYQQDMAQKTAGMPTGQAQDFMAKQGIQYSLGSLQQLQNLITNILPYMTQEMIYKFQDKWFQQEMQLKQQQFAQERFMNQANLNQNAYNQLNGPMTGIFSPQAQAESEAKFQAEDRANAAPYGSQPFSYTPPNLGQSLAQYLNGKQLQNYNPQTGIVTISDPTNGQSTQYSYNPNAAYGQNPFAQINTQTSGQLGQNLSQQAATNAMNILNVSGPPGNTAGLSGTVQNDQGGMSDISSPYSNQQGGQQPGNGGNSQSTGIPGLNSGGLFGTNTGNTYTTGQPQQPGMFGQPNQNSQPQGTQAPVQNSQPNNQSSFNPTYTGNLTPDQASNSFMSAFGNNDFSNIGALA